MVGMEGFCTVITIPFQVICELMWVGLTKSSECLEKKNWVLSDVRDSSCRLDEVSTCSEKATLGCLWDLMPASNRNPEKASDLRSGRGNVKMVAEIEVKCHKSRKPKNADRHQKLGEARKDPTLELPVCQSADTLILDS